MKNKVVQQVLPHAIAVVIFLLVSVIFCKPILDGNVLNQHDIVGWKGMAQNAFEYKEKHGHFPLWNPNLFSGMPNYQVAFEGKSALPDLNIVFTLGLPKPISFFFLACICFYILCVSLRLKPIVGILGALAFAFSTYNPVIIGAGHETKMMAIAYMPLLLAGILLIYNKKYWLGLALTTLGTMMEISSNHPQISYYFFLTAFAITIGYLVYWIKNKDYKHIGIALSTTTIAGIVGLSITTLTLLTSTEYAKATMRGGKSVEIVGDSVKAVNTTGLDASYAFRYSMSKAEPLVMMMPGAFGKHSGNPLKETSKVVDKLTSQGVPEANALQFITNFPYAYWGGMSSPGEGTSGPPYIGAIICILAIIGFVVVKHPLRWGLLAASVLGIMMSWGSYFSGFNLFLLDYLPLYNKFRAPSMSLVIPQLTLPLMAALVLHYLLFDKNSREHLQQNFKKILYTIGGLTALLAIIYIANDYTAAGDESLKEMLISNAGMNDDMARSVISGMKEDRSSMFGGQVLRTIGFMALVLGMIWLYIKNYIKPIVAVAILGVVSMIDLFVIDKDYLGDMHYMPADELQAQSFARTPVDDAILKDTDPNYRVYNMAGDRFNESRTSYFHKSIGGYHPAKLRLYQDVIERYLYNGTNPEILNMLNTKYVIATNPESRQPMIMPNGQAYGHAWLVKNIKLVQDDAAELQTIGSTNLKDTAVVQTSFASAAPQPQWDSTASIKLTKFDNDVMEYSFTGSTPQFAVFSEVYYPYGWNAYIDGKKTDYVKADYVLRGLSIPAGTHAIKFVFEPESYKKGVTISYIGSFLIYIFVLGGFFMAWRQNRQKNKTVNG